MGTRAPMPTAQPPNSSAHRDLWQRERLILTMRTHPGARSTSPVPETVDHRVGQPGPPCNFGKELRREGERKGGKEGRREEQQNAIQSHGTLANTLWSRSTDYLTPGKMVAVSLTPRTGCKPHTYTDQGTANSSSKHTRKETWIRSSVSLAFCFCLFH